MTGSERPRTSTVTDVALLAGVSTATVSRVLNHRATVDPALVSRVREAISQLGYQPSRTARALRTRRSQVWNLVISDIRNDFFGEAARGIEDAAGLAGFAVVLCNTDDRIAKELAYVDLALAERAAGIILSPASAELSRASVERAVAAGVPLVLIDRSLDGIDADSVVVDNRAAAALATHHLVAAGYRRIGCITGPPAVTTARDRLTGYRDALTVARVAFDAGVVRHESYQRDGGRRAATELLALDAPPDAIFIANALQCQGVLEVMRERGAAVPQLGIVCFDDEPWCRLLSPPLTAVAQPAYEIGHCAAELLSRRIDGDREPARRVVLDVELRVRASSARPEG